MDTGTVTIVRKMVKNHVFIYLVILVKLLVNSGDLHASEVYVKTLKPPTKDETFTVEVFIDTVTDLYGLATDVSYDKEYLEVVDFDDSPGNGIQPNVTESTFLSSGGVDETHLRSALEDDTPGNLVLGLSRSGIVQGVDTVTETKILSVTFKAIKEGATTLTFSNSGFRDSSNSDIADVLWKETTINILAAQASSDGAIDADGDGIPDSWEVDNFGNVIVADASTDNDGDGVLDGDEYANNSDPLVVTPIIRSITPSSGSNEGAVHITELAGAHFKKGATVKLTMSGQTDIVAKSVSIISSNKSTCTLDLTGAGIGAWDVELTIPNGETGTLTKGFMVTVAGDDLVAYWKLDEEIGTVAGDSSRHKNDGTIYGDAKWTKGKSGGAIDFDGIDDYIDVGDLDLEDAFSISAWIKLSSFANNMIVGKSFQTYEFFVSPTGQLVANRNSSTPIRLQADLDTKRWYHLVVTQNDTEGMVMYLDGSVISTNSDTSPTNEDNASTKIGATGWTARDFFHGTIDEVRIYNRALTNKEVEAIAALGED